MLRGALQLAGGTAALTAGGWVLRALHCAPAGFGADPASIRAVAQRSPNFRDGAFVNMDPASIVNINRQQLRLLLHVGIPDIAAWWLTDSPLGSAGRIPLRDTVESAPR